MTSSIRIILHTDIARPAGVPIWRPQRMLSEPSSYSLNVECTVRPVMRRAAIPVEAQVT